MKNLKAALLLSSFLSVGSAIAADTATLPNSIVQQIEQAQSQGQDVTALIEQLLTSNPELAESIIAAAIQAVGADNVAAVNQVLTAAKNANVETTVIETVALANNVSQETIQSTLDSAPAAQNNVVAAVPAQNNANTANNAQAGSGSAGGGSGTASGN